MRVALMQAGEERQETRRRAKAMLDEQRDKVRDLALRAVDAGMSEREVGMVAQVDRMTLRRWRGKR